MFHSGFRLYGRYNPVVDTCKRCNRTVATPRPLCNSCEVKERKKK